MIARPRWTSSCGLAVRLECRFAIVAVDEDDADALGGEAKERNAPQL